MKTQDITVRQATYDPDDRYLRLDCLDGERIYVRFMDSGLGATLGASVEAYRRPHTIGDSLAAIDAASRAGMDAQS